MLADHRMLRGLALELCYSLHLFCIGIQHAAGNACVSKLSALMIVVGNAIGAVGAPPHKAAALFFRSQCKHQVLSQQDLATPRRRQDLLVFDGRRLSHDALFASPTPMYL